MAQSTAAIGVRYLAGDRLGIRVRGHELSADQPMEAGGEDSAPTPTELFLASLAGCVAFYAERFLRRHGLSTEGLAVACDYAWAQDPVRVGEIGLTVEAPGLPADRVQAFLRVIEHCPIHNTLRQPPEVGFQLGVARAECKGDRGRDDPGRLDDGQGDGGPQPHRRHDGRQAG